MHRSCLCGAVSLRLAVVLFLLLILVLTLWTRHSTNQGPRPDGRTEIIFWGNPQITDQMMTMPVIVIFFMFQCYFIQGVASAGVKG